MVQGLCSLATICQSQLTSSSSSKVFGARPADWSLHIFPACMLSGVQGRASTMSVAQHPPWCSQVEAGLLAGVSGDTELGLGCPQVFGCRMYC